MMKLQQELNKKRTKHHVTGCIVAIVGNVFWGIANYFLLSENQLLYTTLHLISAAIILIVLLNRKRLKLSSETLVFIPFITTLAALGYTYNTVDLETFRQVTYTHMAVFIGGGLFLLWRIKYSLLTILYALVINALFFSLSPLTLEEYLGNGALAVVTVMIFMVFATEMRLRLVTANINTTIELNRSKERLKTSEEQHRLLFEQNPTAMLICSMDSMEIIAANDAIIEKYGYSKEEFIGMPISKLHREIDLKDVLLRSDDTEKCYERVSDWVHVLKDRTEINVELVEKILRYKNKKSRLISINDVTATKRYESELIEARMIAEESKEMQSQFLSNMSHEIRTPMNGIMGITRILQNTDMSEEQRHFLDAIIKSSENLMVIINDILDFSKIEAGKIVLEEKRFNLKKMVEVAHEVLAVSAEEKRVYFSVRMDDDVPERVHGDSVRLNQILMNLVSNGIKFTEHGGVTLNVKNLGEQEGKARIRFSVRDTGIGIPENKLETIFESFTQASSSTTRKHGGTGLGLSISRQLAELQGGRIWVESGEGEGSTFFVEIPYTIDDVENMNTESADKKAAEISEELMLQALTGRKILLVEDHPINQMLAMKVLRDWNIDVALAENGRIALDMIGKDDFELVLMDISMPEMDGYTATREIRSGKYTENNDIPIIAMTASALIGENQKCFKAGMNDYITKPFEPSLLMERIYSGLSNTHLKRA